MPHELMSQIRGLVIDMDGVLWRDKQPIGDLPKIFAQIKALGLKCVLATNNSSLTPEQYLEKLAGFGVSLEKWQIVTSGMGTIHYLAQKYPGGCAVYVVGEDGLRVALKENGFTEAVQGVQAVIVGIDWDVTYQKLKTATLLIRGGAHFIATNTDKSFPTPEGLIPGAGALVAAVETATDQKPVVIGKPSPLLYEFALERLGIPAAQALAIGDRLETDIAGGQKAGCRTAMVLSGIATRQAASEWKPAPDIVAPDLSSILF